jgi:hypothetical protein
MGNGFFEINPGPPTLRTRAAAARSMATVEDSLFGSSETEDDEDDNPFSGFFRAVHGRSVVMGGASFTTTISSSSRSYASNVNDRNAGNGAENPLEIEDDSDEEVEVVQVTRP